MATTRAGIQSLASGRFARRRGSPGFGSVLAFLVEQGFEPLQLLGREIPSIGGPIIPHQGDRGGLQRQGGDKGKGHNGSPDQGCGSKVHYR